MAPQSVLEQMKKILLCKVTALVSIPSPPCWTLPLARLWVCALPSVGAAGGFPHGAVLFGGVWDVPQVWGQPCPALRAGAECVPRLAHDPQSQFCVLCSLPGEFPLLLSLAGLALPSSLRERPWQGCTSWGIHSYC